MLKKLFEWTPLDIAYWENIHKKGLRNFVVMYGVVTTGGVLFLAFGIFSMLSWLVHMPIAGITTNSILFLTVRLIFVALVCLAAGVVNSLITWVVEDRLYLKYKARSEKEGNC